MRKAPLSLPTFWLSSLLYSFAWFCLLGSAKAHAEALSTSPCSRPVHAGAAKSSILGPVLGSALNGYAELTQRSEGLHMRPYIRAFTFLNPCDGKLVSLLLADLAMVHQNIRDQILSRLQDILPGRFDNSNLLLSATHTHASPGGYSPHILYNISSLGSSPETLEAIVEGGVEAVLESYRKLEPVKISFSSRELMKASWNRSLEAYAANPQDERDQFNSNVDTGFNQLSIQRASTGENMSVLTWFAVHPVSLPLTNRLISGDNKGLAAYLTEKSQTGTDFVAGFFQSNSGDVSPYPISGHSEDRLNSPNQFNEDNSSPDQEQEGWERLEKSARSQFEMAKRILHEIPDKDNVMEDDFVIDARSVFIDFNRFMEEGWRGYYGDELCSAALGVSFAAGTENGQPLKLFSEGTVYGDNWPEITLMPDLQRCQSEKVILLPTGLLGWTAKTLPYQLIRIGSVLIVGAPFELTTMAGRRLRNYLLELMAPVGIKTVLIAGLSNEYAHYVTTPEEYKIQHYEGGSTLFGPHSLAAHSHIFKELANAMRDGQSIQGHQPSKVALGDISSQIAGPSSVWVGKDGARKEESGSLEEMHNPEGDRQNAAQQDVFYLGDKVQFEFWTGSPNRRNMRNKAFFEIERWHKGSWQLVATDEDHDTRVSWKRYGFHHYKMKLTWHASSAGVPGLYRVCWESLGRENAKVSQSNRNCEHSFEMRINQNLK